MINDCKSDLGLNMANNGLNIGELKPGNVTIHKLKLTFSHKLPVDIIKLNKLSVSLP